MMNPDRSVDLVVIATFGLPVEAEVAASVLAAEGIDCIIEKPFVSGIRPSWLPGEVGGQGVRLRVRQEDEEVAREILEHVEPSEPSDSE